MCLGLDAGRQPDEHRLDAALLRPCDLLECVEHNERAHLRGHRQLGVGLVVAVEDQPLCGNAGTQRELQLAQCRHVRTEPLGREQPQEGDVREGLRPVDDERPRVHTRVRARPRENSIPAVHDERRAELLRELRRPHAAEHELAALDGSRVGEEL